MYDQVVGPHGTRCLVSLIVPCKMVFSVLGRDLMLVRYLLHYFWCRNCSLFTASYEEPARVSLKHTQFDLF
jgi:hypothetical protein